MDTKDTITWIAAAIGIISLVALALHELGMI